MKQYITTMKFESLDNKHATAINAIDKVFALLAIEGKEKLDTLEYMSKLGEE